MFPCTPSRTSPSSQHLNATPRKPAKHVASEPEDAVASGATMIRIRFRVAARAIWVNLTGHAPRQRSHIVPSSDARILAASKDGAAGPFLIRDIMSPSIDVPPLLAECDALGAETTHTNAGGQQTNERLPSSSEGALDFMLTRCANRRRLGACNPDQRMVSIGALN